MAADSMRPPGDGGMEAAAVAGRLRRRTIEMLWQAQAGHPGGSMSVAEILAVLYFGVMNIDSARPDWVDRDRFVLSKGHAAPIYYAALVERGYFPEELLRSYDELDSGLQAHPYVGLPGIDSCSGSLGQGLSVGIGLALGARLRGSGARMYVLLGDGELQEGQVWEAAMAASSFGLGNLTAIVDANRLQLCGTVESIVSVEPLPDKWRAFGWNVLQVDGHDCAALEAAFRAAVETTGRPTVIIAHTVKGKGVSFMENSVEWHSAAVTDEVRERALAELAAGVTS
ncbi:MAG: transketolase [Thermoleophilia bacterium]